MNTLPELRHEGLGRLQWRALWVGVAALALCVLGAPFSPTQFFRAYLAAYFFYLGLALGALTILMIYHLTGGAWGFLTRRTLEAATRTLPLLAVLFIPIACGVSDLYLWAQPDVVEASKNLQYKQRYLNVPFWCVRAAVFFVLWIGVAYLLNLWSRRQDETGDPRMARRLTSLSGPGLVVYGLTITFASVDWLMSLQPSFHSTIFGPLCASGQVLSAHAFAVLVFARLTVRPPLGDLVSRDALNDLGNLLFTFLIVWAYMVWFQFMLIWIANLPTDVIWYTVRAGNVWEWVARGLCVFHFVIPFFLLLLRDVKRDPRALAGVAALVLVTHLVYVYYLVMPPFQDTAVTDHWMDFLTPFGLGGLWLADFLWELQRYPILPRHDENEQSAVHLREAGHEHELRQEEVRHG